MQKFESFRVIKVIRITFDKELRYIFIFSSIEGGSLFHLKLIQHFSKQFQIA